MPYSSPDGEKLERASRLGHIAAAQDTIITQALHRWQIPETNSDDTAVADQLVEAATLPRPFTSIRYVIALDGSDQEVQAHPDFPSARVGYLQISGARVDLEAMRAARIGNLINPVQFRRASSVGIITGVLPCSQLTSHGRSGFDTFRDELYQYFKSSSVTAGSQVSLLEALFVLYASPRRRANALPVPFCPTCRFPDLLAPKLGIACPECEAWVYPTDALQIHTEYESEGSNGRVLNRTMSASEHLAAIAYLIGLYRSDPNQLAQTAFILDGPLGLFGPTERLNRYILRFLQALAVDLREKGGGPPVVLGAEKTGVFVDHAAQISDQIMPGHLVRLSSEYLNTRLKRRPHYGADDFYGRRFIYKTSDGSRVMVISVPRYPAGSPYDDIQCDLLDNYPTLGATTELLDQIGTRMYANASIPTALAHRAASLPIGTGSHVLQLLTKDHLGADRSA